MKKFSFLFALMLIAASFVWAAEPINKMCPVSGDEINPKVTIEHDGKTIGFCCKKCVKKFKADPKKYMKAIESGDETAAADHDHMM